MSIITYRVEDWDGHEHETVDNIQTMEAAERLARKAYKDCPDHIITVYAIQGPRVQQLMCLSEDSSDYDAWRGL